MKDVSGETLRVDADQHRAELGRHIAERERERFFGFMGPDAFETVNAKMPETGREIGFGYLVQLKIRQVSPCY
jgi:hypothetical protein